MAANRRQTRPKRQLVSTRVFATRTFPRQAQAKKALEKTTSTRSKPTESKMRTVKTVSTRPLLGKRVLDAAATRERMKGRRIMLHPLGVEFDEKTREYADELYAAAQAAMDEAYDGVLAKLEDNGEQKVLARLETRRLADEEYESESIPKSKLGDRIERFKGILRAEQAKIAKLAGDYENVVKEVKFFVAKELGVDDEGEAALVKKIQALEKEIEELGDKEIEELEAGRKAERDKKTKLARFLKELE